ncbi:hypothetical protein Hbl1158_04905 [Halobaculum sp. CBA1158]|uniref:DUF6663 family protein n=1 Tax=Halobaculum sp. CBA1158 TaxID=2904243 RepID=UPI001F43BBA9|nr:DUF6663 family protein [Halobaculum sp. CBA1158]UIP00702.1 hypothetical protein Hbl1158_04905 [Halobaculum sp. CBA1158]
MDANDDESVDPWGDGDDDWVGEATGSGDEAGGAGSADGVTSTDNAADGADGAGDAGGETDTACTAADRDAGALGPRRYRVLDRDDDEIVLVDLDTPEPGPGRAPDEGFEPVRVDAGADAGDATGADGTTAADLAETVADLDPGYVIESTLRWPAPAESAGDDHSPLASFDSLSIRRRGRFHFVDEIEPVFEAAEETWRDARAAGDGMGSRVTRDTDGEPNGALYVFGEGGARDLFEEFRSGTTPLEPLVERVDDDLADDAPREVFVLRPADDPFVIVYIAFERDGLLARTVRDTYL